MTFDELSKNLKDYLKGEIIRVEGSGSWHSVWLSFNDWDGGDTERCTQLVFTGVAEAHCRAGKLLARITRIGSPGSLESPTAV